VNAAATTQTSHSTQDEKPAQPRLNAAACPPHQVMGLASVFPLGMAVNVPSCAPKT